MENNLQVFNNMEFGDLRIITKNDEYWFVGKDVAEILGYSNTRDALAKHVDNEDKADVAIHDGRQNRSMVVINESGLYSLILSSKLPKAKEFKRWVTSEILPSIRKTGSYNMPNFDDPVAAARAWADAVEARRQAQKQIEADRPKVLFADAVATAKTSILIGELAKLIKQNGYDIGQKRLFNFLREKGYLIKRKGIDYNMPTQKSMNLGLFEIKERTINHTDHVEIVKTTKVTGKGQIYFINLFGGKQKENTANQFKVLLGGATI